MEINYQKIIAKFGKNRVKVNEPLSAYTTFKIGGPADLFYEAKTVKEVVTILNLAREINIPYFILGGGSNLLISDQGFRGLVVKTNNARFKVYKESGRFKIMTGAGLKLSDLVGESVRLGLTGLEFLISIPGTIGGAVRGNAGAWLSETGERVESVRIFDNNGKLIWLKKNQCRFSYRDSRFKKTNEVILEVKFSLKKGDSKKIKKMVNEYREKKGQQPQGFSAGCVFINPKSQPAGALIDQCGLKGKRIGGAQISPQHANFIINTGKATAEDVLKLINLAKSGVKKKFGMELREEIQLVGFD